MRKDLEQILVEFRQEVERVATDEHLKQLHGKYFSREKGVLSAQLRRIREIPVAERPGFGQDVNLLKQEMEAEFDRLTRTLADEDYHRRVEQERLDITLPAVGLPRGSFHPIKMVEQELCGIFERMGYSIVEGPEIETDFYNFGALNFPPDHPARDEQDTFFVAGGRYLLRTHTSPVQIRTMQQLAPPLKIIAPGKVFRKDTPDATHYPIFHQIEGLVVAENVSLADLKGTLHDFARQFFAPDVRVRLRPSFFPFVEPGAEVDISCIFCGGSGCRICKQSGWIEILGAGMVHPNVFVNCGLDPEEHTGFAFGMGVDRMAILKYGVPDIRMFWENDVRFLNQFWYVQ
ncbi:MAG: phenylalanine--tRNA ligase subunit alpha [Acidobacteria bacterium]|nr:phenylalanine--tRNA ligase subunit alpha [Acidobacteriota bacterium]